MTFLEKLRFDFWDGDRMVASVIEKWRPESCSTEWEFERSLYIFLHERFTELQVTKQFASGRIRADIAVEDKIIIELKNNLDTTSKYHRLVGQLESYKNWNGSVFVVLCGRTDRNLFKELKRRMKNMNNGYSMEERYWLFEK